MKTNLYNNQIFTLDEILSNSKCEEIIKKADLKGWNDSSPSGGGHGRTGNEDARDNKFCVYYDEELSNKLMLKIKNIYQKILNS